MCEKNHHLPHTFHTAKSSHLHERYPHDLRSHIIGSAGFGRQGLAQAVREGTDVWSLCGKKKKKSSTQPADGMFLNDTMFFVQDLLPAGNHCSFPGISFKDKNKNISFGEGDQKGDRCHSPTDQTAYQRRVSKRFLFGKGVHMYIIYIYILYIYIHIYMYII